MNEVYRMMTMAAEISRLKEDARHYYLGAVGIRRDGVLVASANGAHRFPESQHHAEARVLRKLGKGGILYVVRTLANGDWSISTPCEGCRALIKAHRVKKVYYFNGRDIDWTEGPNYDYSVIGTA